MNKKLELYCLKCRRFVNSTHKQEYNHSTYKLGRFKSKNRKGLKTFKQAVKYRIPVPTTYDLRISGTGGGIGIGPIYDQMSTGCCVAFAWGNIIMWEASKQAQAWTALSQEMIYDVGRTMNGAFGQDGMDSNWGPEELQASGTCPLAEDPYQNTDNGTMPSNQAYNDAKNYMISSYAQIEDVADMYQAILQFGCISIGIPVYESFMNSLNGIIPMPSANEQLLGGHELCVCGWTVINGLNYFIFKNSWYIIPGVEPWGSQGFGFLEEAYMTKYFADPVNTADSYSAIYQVPAPPTPGTPYITVYPLTVAPNNSINIAGSNFTPSGSVGIAVGTNTTSTPADPNGNFNVNYVMNVATNSTYAVIATDFTTSVASNTVNVLVQSQSTCPVGRGIAKLLNIFAALLGREGKFYYLVKG